MTTINAVNTTLSGQTGTGSFVGSASPTFTGTPVLPTPFTLGATSVTSTGTQLNLLNASTVVPINKIVTQSFTSSGTYTPTAGMVYCIIECLAGGGGGGGVANSTAGQQGGAGGGGSGGYSRAIATAATIGVSQTVTIGGSGTAGANTGGTGGSGGNTSVGAICIANGGSGGTGGPGGAGGGGGALGTGNLILAGNNGTWGGFASILTVTMAAGGGGFSILGSGSTAIVFSQASFNGGNSAGNSGSGGGGGFSYNAGGAKTGGTGGNGQVFITEFLNA